MGTTSIVKKIYPCFYNDLEKSELIEDQISTLNEISLEKFKSLIPNKIYNSMLKDKFPNYIQADDYFIKTVKEDSENKQIKINIMENTIVLKKKMAKVN